MLTTLMLASCLEVPRDRMRHYRHKARAARIISCRISVRLGSIHSSQPVLRTVLVVTVDLPTVEFA